MAAVLRIDLPDASEAVLRQETVRLSRLLSGQPDLAVARPEDAPIAPGERGGALELGTLLVTVAAPEAIRTLMDGLKLYLARDPDWSISVTGENGEKIEMRGANVAPDQLAETAARLRALLAAEA